MRIPVIRSAVGRGLITSGIAVLAAAGTKLLLSLSDSLSPSSPPWTPWDLALDGLAFLWLTFIVCVTWLLPGAVILGWVMSRRGIRGILPAIGFGLVGAAIACGALILPDGARPWLSPGGKWNRLAGTAIEFMAFFVAWLVSFERLSPPKAGVEAPAPRAFLTSLRRRGVRTAVEALAIGGFALWSVIIGFVGVTFLEFWGEDEYRVRFWVDSPERKTRAYVVERASPGGALGDLETQVYLVGATERWTRSSRGLLMWRSADLDVVDVRWDSANRIRVEIDPEGSPSDARAFRRRGFTAVTGADESS